MNTRFFWSKKRPVTAEMPNFQKAQACHSMMYHRRKENKLNIANAGNGDLDFMLSARMITVEKMQRHIIYCVINKYVDLRSICVTIVNLRGYLGLRAS